MTDAMIAALPADRVRHEAMPTLADIPRYFGADRPAAIAISFEGRDTDWATLDARSDRVAARLMAAGCRTGDRIAFAGKNGDEFFELLFGAAKAGIVIVPIIWRLAAPEIVAIVADSAGTLLFLGPDQLDRVADFAAALPTVGLVAMGEGGAGLDRFADWRDVAASAPALPSPDPHAVALQIYTSGTTGRPKGVMLSHANILHGRREASHHPMEWHEWRRDDVNLVALPVGHIGGVGWAIVGFFNGARTVVQREFVPGPVLDALEHGGVSKLFVVPTALQMLLMQPRVREIDFARLRYILYGASPIALDLLREATEVFGCGFCQQYGATETCGTIVYLPPEDHRPGGTDRMRAAGLPMPGVEIRIVAPGDRRILPPGEVGEVETRSVANMVGYWNQPEATAETLSADGWLRTGDAGYLDADGYLTIHDRFKDMICTGAENVYPAEVESAIYGHPAVQEVAVIGVPDPKWGESVKAMIVLKAGAAPDAEAIIAFARTRIAAFKAPKSIEFIDALPRNPSGKVLRRVLREPYWAGRDRGVN